MKNDLIPVIIIKPKNSITGFIFGSLKGFLITVKAQRKGSVKRNVLIK